MNIKHIERFLLSFFFVIVWLQLLFCLPGSFRLQALVTNLLPDWYWLCHRDKRGLEWRWSVCVFVSRLVVCKLFKVSAACCFLVRDADLMSERSTCHTTLRLESAQKHKARHHTAGKVPGVVRAHPITKKQIRCSLHSKAKVSCQSVLRQDTESLLNQDKSLRIKASAKSADIFTL